MACVSRLGPAIGAPSYAKAAEIIRDQPGKVGIQVEPELMDRPA
jgi:hypothetical protein